MNRPMILSEKMEWVLKTKYLRTGEDHKKLLDRVTKGQEEEERKKMFSDEIAIAMKKEIEASLHGDLW